VVSVFPADMDPSEMAFRLDQEYGILTRVGLHCAPSAHKCLGTFPSGTVRFSFGRATTEDEIGAAAQALRVICG
ncbi:MAG: aminotransferase class V-fold PLP-dependent enzyme, partial [Lachnospiraceae bacterium]|nr:aminotransferase class V-fold PLP-dependent enzyme [Lachnospiraceae bacterium]